MNKLEELRHKRIAVLGYGVEGRATIEYLLKHGIKPDLLDELLTTDDPQIEILRSKGIICHLGKNILDRLVDYEIAFRSPGISPKRQELLLANHSGVQISSQTQLFFDLCETKNIIGITGTKGKGTTSTLIYELLLKQGYDAYLCGNIGKPPLEYLDNINEQSYVVMELSSFQLIDLKSSPHIAVMLMITSEHLDYHLDVYEYIDAKRNILRFQKQSDYAILNRDYIATNESDVHSNGQVFNVSIERECALGCFVKDGKVMLRKSSVSTQEIIDVNDVLLPGKHNLENVCASIMAASLMGVIKPNIVAVLKTFAGLPHRLQLVRELNGVKYYDDSFSTTPETAIAAILAFKQPEILILGGSSKNSDFAQLGNVIRKATNIKAIIGIGLEWERIKDQIANKEGQITKDLEMALLIEGAVNMQQIVAAASKLAVSGDVVLLSPACASFGMFSNYKDRGEQFTKEVNSL